MTKDMLIAALPPYEDKWIVVNPDQDVYDIIQDILDKHKRFSGYYDRIALFFNGDSITEICNKLYDFCENEIEYKEEKSSRQTTSIPTGFLLRGHGDCKHYASFIGGVLDGLNRLTGKKIHWFYRFVSYDPLSKPPRHVFVVVDYNGEEIWIDPVPGARDQNPSWKIDKKINSKSMPLYSNIGGVQEQEMGSITAVIPVITNLFKSIFGNIPIGDQVEGYPVESKVTFEGIVNDVHQLFPNDPRSITEAKEMLIRSKQYANDAYNKGGDVNTTYGMLYDKVSKSLQQYIEAAGGNTDDLTAGEYYPGNGTTSAGVNTKTLLIVGGLGLGAYLLLKPKNKKVSGMNDAGMWFIIGLAGYAIYMSNKPNNTPVTE